MAQAIELLIVGQQKAEEAYLADEDAQELRLPLKSAIVAEDE